MPPCAAAINSVPRQQIRRQVEKARREAGYTGGLRVVISAPGGAQVAQKTFNPRLGIRGGISILGTSGIVEPMSQQAVADTIRLELSRLYAQGRRSMVLTLGNYGQGFLEKELINLALITVKCANFLGETIGKLIKLAGSIMNTHSSYADARLAPMTAHTTLCGGADVYRGGAVQQHPWAVGRHPRRAGADREHA